VSGTTTEQLEHAGKITMLPGCVAQLKKLTSKEGQQSRFLRFTVDSGGCSGYQYAFKMDGDENLKPEKGDVVFEQEGVRLVTDTLSLTFVSDAEIDYTT